MVERIKLLMDYFQMSSTNFADTIGISRSAMTHLLNGRNQPSLDVVKKILSTFPNISTDWLMLGQGNMMNDKNIAQPNNQDTQNPQSTPTTETFQQFDLFDDRNFDSQALSNNQTQISNSQRVVDGKMKKSTNDETSSKRKPRQTHTAKDIVRIVFFYSDNSFEEYTNL